MIDPSQGYLNATMALQQRPQVEEELKAMRRGEPPEQFRVLGEAMVWLRERSQLARIHLLDAGCASAYYHDVLEHYVPGWVKYTGLDFNVEATKMAKALYPGLTVFEGDILRMMFTTQQFDAVLTAATLNHIKDWKAALFELARACRHWLILHRVPSHSGPTETKTVEAYGQTVWDIVFNDAELEEAVKKRGFERIWVEKANDLTTQVWERTSDKS